MLRIFCFLIDILILLVGVLLGVVLRLVLLPFPAAHSRTYSTLVWTGARFEN